jgi:hypothetical protein
VSLTNKGAISQGKQYLMKKDFLKRMDDSGNLFIKPNELRKKYTEFVMFNKARALLPSRKSLINGLNSYEELKTGASKSNKNRSLNSMLNSTSFEQSFNKSQGRQSRDQNQVS